MALSEKVKTSIERIRAFDPSKRESGKPYFVAFSGGKDSVVVKALMDMAGVKYESHYRVTSADPPELVTFIKVKYPDVSRDKPLYTEKGGGAYRGEEWVGKQITMWNLISWKLMLPTRTIRYCCDLLKESNGDGRMAVTGVRWAESVNRSKRQGLATIMGNVSKELGDNPYFRLTGSRGAVLVNDNTESRQMLDQCVSRHKTVLNPIIEWTDRDVWDFIKAENVPYCELYDCGWHRLGCIGCPMASKAEKYRQFARWPTYKTAYLRAIGKMLDERKKRGKGNDVWGTTAIDVFHWWMEDGVLPGQMDLFEEEDDDL